MFGLNGASGLGAALKARTVSREAARVDAFEPLGQGLETVGLFLGDARDAVFVAQQMRDLLVEDLPGEHARLVQDLAAVFGVGVAVEIEPLVEKPFARALTTMPNG